MTSNNKEVQRRADDKRQGLRSRAWWVITYLAWEVLYLLLNDLHVKCFVSPLHDRDIGSDGSPVKPHYHVLFLFDGPVGYRRAIELFDAIEGVYPDPEAQRSAFIRKCRVNDQVQAARYLCHLDNPEKFAYDIALVESLGGLSYPIFIDTGDATLLHIFSFMEEYDVRTYPRLIHLLKCHHPEWIPLVAKKYMRCVIEYAKGLNFENRSK